jgi:hypothetical protein
MNTALRSNATSKKVSTKEPKQKNLLAFFKKSDEGSNVESLFSRFDKNEANINLQHFFPVFHASL